MAQQSEVLHGIVSTLDIYTNGLQVYCVGGAVRDALLGLPAGDRDWVVVGSTPEEMLKRGFTPVGGDFPVFLHPKTREEYALARTERKSGRGYQGFTFYTGKEVSLEDDLLRRDLTINAMAVDVNGKLYDPYGGLHDLRCGIFRHVSEAFIEDPVRLLRLGRFLSRFEHFLVAPETLTLCQQMVSNHEVDALVPERVWKEISRSLMCAKPSRFFEFLIQVGALTIIAPRLHWSTEVGNYLDCNQMRELTLEQRYALLCYLGIPSNEDRELLSQYWRVSKEQADYARCFPFVIDSLQSLPHNLISVSADTAEQIVQFLEKIDGIRKTERFLALIQVASLLSDTATMPFYLAQWDTCLHVVKGVAAGDIARQYAPDTQAIKRAVHQARVSAIMKLLSRDEG